MTSTAQEPLRRALEAAFEAGDAAEIRTAYTNIGLAHYARKRYGDAIQCFEEQVTFITNLKPSHLLEEADLTALSFAYRLLALLHGEEHDEERAAAYNRKCQEVEMDICLACFAREEDAEGQPPDFTALRDQLVTSREEVAPMLIASPKFPSFLNAMLLYTNDVSEQVLQVVVTLLAQPYPKIHRRACEHMVTVIGGLLSTLVQAGTYGRQESRLLKMSGVALRMLLPRVPWAFDDRVPLAALETFVHSFMTPGSGLHTLWTDVVHAIHKRVRGRQPASAGNTSQDLSESTYSSTGMRTRRSSFDLTRSPSHLGSSTSVSSDTYSSDGDSTTFISLASDDDTFSS